MRLVQFLSFMLCCFSAVAQSPAFDTTISYPVREVAHLFHTKDITGDGYPDLTLFYSAAFPDVDLLAGDGQGRFSNAAVFTKENNYHLSDIAHLNGDNYPDMVISSYWNNGFKIYFGQGAGKFKEGPFMATGVHGRNIKCSDINKDGVTDIVATTSGSGHTISLHIFLGKGDGSFEEKKSFASVLDTCKDIIITDKNSDGLPDVVVTSSFPWIVLFIQKPDGNFEPVYFPTHHTARIVFADINKDYADDMILLYSSFDNEPGSDSLIIKLNEGGLAFSESIKVTSFENRSLRPYQVQASDLNKDGFIDLVFNQTNLEGYATDTVFYMTGKDGVAFHNAQFLKFPAAIAEFQLTDMDGNGWPDLVVSGQDKKLYITFTGRNDLLYDQELLVYPNPARNEFYTETSFTPPYVLRLYNASGQLVYQKQGLQQRLFSSVNFPAGIYYVTVSKGEKKITRRLLVTR